MNTSKQNFAFLCYLAFVLCLACKSEPKPSSLSVIYRPLDSIDLIEPIVDSLVTPIVYTNTVSLAHLAVETKKQKFIAMILPAILIAKQQVERNKEDILVIKTKLQDKRHLNVKEEVFLNMMLKQYSVNHIDSLITKMISPPTSIVLAQAAIECGWGTSRFFTEGANVFGIWSFSKYDERMKSTKDRAGGKKIYLKKYEHLGTSVEDYLRILGKLNVYKNLRQAIKDSDDPFEILPHLNSYSEAGPAYTQKIARLIKHNNLTAFDHYSIDPVFLIQED